jgi:hypothetical protein
MLQCGEVIFSSTMKSRTWEAWDERVARMEERCRGSEGRAAGGGASGARESGEPSNAPAARAEEDAGEGLNPTAAAAATGSYVEYAAEGNWRVGSSNG